MSRCQVFRRGGHFECNFTRKRTSPTNHCWCQKIKVIVLSYSIKISAVHCLVLSQSKRRQTDRQTDRRTDEQNYDSEYRTSIAACAVKSISHERREFGCHFVANSFRYMQAKNCQNKTRFDEVVAEIICTILLHSVIWQKQTVLI